MATIPKSTPGAKQSADAQYPYQPGFGNEHSSEALPGALPIGQFSPQKCPYGLYAEKFSSTAFTVARAGNRRTWFYRIRPSVVQSDFHRIDDGLLRSGPITEVATPPNQLRWDAFPIPTQPTDFVQGLATVAANGNAAMQQGMGVHMYLANHSMVRRFFYNADGEMLLVPQQGRVVAFTECGVLDAGPGEILLIPRGMKFRIELPDGPSRGYVCENYGALFTLPERGPVGSDGFSNARDFLAPTAAYVDQRGDFELICKFGGHLYVCEIKHSALDVVAWVGNSVPYKYDLARFNVMGTVSYDHPDPSIFTVMTSPSDSAGTANVDFVIFPPRWIVTEHTFRPPWYHRNVMSEFMGLIKGVYDAKEEGFVPGGASLHNCMSAHGPDRDAFEKATNAALKPVYMADTMAFMFESRYVIQPTRFALECPQRQKDYVRCWDGLESHFTGIG